MGISKRRPSGVEAASAAVAAHSMARKIAQAALIFALSFVLAVAKPLAASTILCSTSAGAAASPQAQMAFADTGDQAATASSSVTSSTTNSGSFVIDECNLFDSATRTSLESKAKSISNTYGVGVYLLAVSRADSSNGQSSAGNNLSARSFAINYYKTNNLGLGSGNSGILFLIAVDSRDYVTITYGDGANAFTDYQVDQMEDTIVGELSNGEWANAAQTYLDKAEYTLKFRADRGEALDSGNAPTGQTTMLIYVGIAALIAIAAGVFYCIVLYRQMKTAVQASEANDYVDRDSFKLTGRSDRFVNSTVVATPKPKPQANGGGPRMGGGGGFGGSSGGKF